MRIAALALALALGAPPPAQDASAGRLPDAQKVRARVEAILSSPEYDTGVPRNVPNPLLERIFQKFKDLFEALSRLGETAPALFWMILVACLAILAAIFTHAGWVLFRALRAARSEAPGGACPRTRRKDDPRALLERAAAAAAQGRFTEAIRLCHRAAILALDSRGIVRFHESLTTGDYAARLRGRPREREPFGALAQMYEAAYFGLAPVGDPEASECRRLAAALLGEERA